MKRTVQWQENGVIKTATADILDGPASLRLAQVAGIVKDILILAGLVFTYLESRGANQSAKSADATAVQAVDKADKAAETSKENGRKIEDATRRGVIGPREDDGADRQPPRRGKVDNRTDDEIRQDAIRAMQERRRREAAGEGAGGDENVRPAPKQLRKGKIEEQSFGPEI